ncbi:MAG TPA: helix-turn-helix domain-containing protein [Gemmatimonadales bacterium]|nr:helix-turn-helix domain-containing protein [Gemmatimonadales bacterium]
MPPALAADISDKLLDAADRLMGREGYAKMTVESLAREVGIGKGSVYLLYPSKREIALACIDRNAARVRERLAELAMGEESATIRLRAMLHERVMIRFDYAQGHSESLDALLASFRAELLERRWRQFAMEARQVSGVIEQGIQSQEFRQQPALSVGESLITATNALLPFSLSAAELGKRSTVAARVDRIIMLMLLGLGRPNSTARPELQ